MRQSFALFFTITQSTFDDTNIPCELGQFYRSLVEFSVDDLHTEPGETDTFLNKDRTFSLQCIIPSWHVPSTKQASHILFTSVRRGAEKVYSG